MIFQCIWVLVSLKEEDFVYGLGSGHDAVGQDVWLVIFDPFGVGPRDIGVSILRIMQHAYLDPPIWILPQKVDQSMLPTLGSLKLPP
jgi:hypothetical protein